MTERGKALSHRGNSWRARDWNDLRSIWEKLAPNLTDPDSPRSFRGHPLTAQEAGSVFERWIMEAFRLSGATIEYPFLVPMATSGSVKEQLDGLVLQEWQGFLVESKFWPGRRVDFEPIAQLHFQVERRPSGTLGLFFAAYGFSPPALELAVLQRPMRVLLFDGDDLKLAVSSKSGMTKMVRQKWIEAIKYGVPYSRFASQIRERITDS